MKDISKMRLDLIKELKQIIHFFQDMEKGVKSRDPSKIYPAYMYISTLVYHMREGDLSTLSIELKHELLHNYKKEYLE